MINQQLDNQTVRYGYIYITYNKINGKIYIGQKKSDKFIPSYYGSGYNIRKALIKYTLDNFEVYPIAFYNSAEELDIAERYWIRKYNSTDRNIGYNISEGGIWGKCEYTDEEKKQISKKLSKSIHNFYINETPEHRKKRLSKLSESLRGREISDITRKHMSESAKLRGGALRGRISVSKGNDVKYINKEELQHYLSLGYLLGNNKIKESNISRTGSLYKRYTISLNGITLISSYYNLEKDIENTFGVCPTRTILKQLIRTGESYKPYRLKYKKLSGMTIKKEVISNL